MLSRPHLGLAASWRRGREGLGGLAGRGPVLGGPEGGRGGGEADEGQGHQVRRGLHAAKTKRWA